MENIEFGLNAKLYVIENSAGMQAELSDYGATLVKLLVPDKHGALTDVVLGYESAAGYRDGTVFFGASVGRNANRIGGAAFELNGTRYSLDANDNANNLHSGMDFYNKRIWTVKEQSQQSVTFVLHSQDGDQGYPGNAEIEVTYTLTEENGLGIRYSGISDMDTVFNMTNHSYFNLNGHASGTIKEHLLWIDADSFTRADCQSIPTGELVNVEGTPMDFRVCKPIGRDIEAGYEALNYGSGYDHNYALNHAGTFRKSARLQGDVSGIVMEVFTDLPGMQLYTGNFIEEENGKDGAVYRKRDGVCFETQYFPDAVNQPEFESPVMGAGVEYKTSTVYRFHTA